MKVLIPESNKKYCRKTVVGTVGVVFDDGSIYCYDTVNEFPRWYKPVLKPCDFAISDLSGYELIYAIEKHHDVAGLIEKGQAIDVNSLEFNPYKK